MFGELKHSDSSYTMAVFHGSIFWHVKFLEKTDASRAQNRHCLHPLADFYVRTLLA